MSSKPYIHKIHKRVPGDANPLYGEPRVRALCTPDAHYGANPDHVTEEDERVTCRPCIGKMTGKMPPKPEFKPLTYPKTKLWCGLALSSQTYNRLTCPWYREKAGIGPTEFTTLDDLRRPDARARLLSIEMMGKKKLMELDDAFFQMTGEHIGGMEIASGAKGRCPTCGQRVRKNPK